MSLRLKDMCMHAWWKLWLLDIDSTINMKNIKENKDWIKSRIFEFSLFNNSLTIYEQMLNLEDNITNWGKVCDLHFYDVYAK